MEVCVISKGSLEKTFDRITKCQEKIDHLLSTHGEKMENETWVFDNKGSVLEEIQTNYTSMNFERYQIKKEVIQRDLLVSYLATFDLPYMDGNQIKAIYDDIKKSYPIEPNADFPEPKRLSPKESREFFKNELSNFEAYVVRYLDKWLIYNNLFRKKVVKDRSESR